MLKGTMKIELTDVHTGDKETVLEHNMVTSALSEIFKPLGLIKSPEYFMDSWAPYYQKLLGGILLFNTKLEENATNLYPPASAKLIGCAAYGLQNNTVGTSRGGYNQTESELNLANRYMKYVYDFATSQANGTIPCVCLTHLHGGFTSYGSENTEATTSYPLGLRIDDGQLQYVHTEYTGANTGDKSSGFSVGSTEFIFVIDREADTVYYFRVNTATSISIIKRRAYLKSVSILENPYTKKALIEEINVAELGIAIDTEYCTSIFDTKDNALYICTATKSYINEGESFLITKIVFGTWEVTQYSMVNTTDTYLDTSGTRFAMVHDGYAYLTTRNSPYEIYKFEVGNAANVVKMTRNGMSSVLGYALIAINGRIYYGDSSDSSGTSYVCIANAATNEILKPESSKLYNSSSVQYSYTPVINEPMLFYISCGSNYTAGFAIMANYLATINNLTEPVTKTADKTMKITYIIQEQ